MDTEDLVKCIIRSIMCLAGIIGNNWLCITSFPRSISQLKTADILFVNLAVSNLITNFLVDPANILKSFKDLPVGKVFCGFLFFLPELSETSSVMSTVYITVYWHQKLVGSLKRGGAPVLMDNLRLLAALLIGSWTFALVISLPHFFFITQNSRNTTNAECNEELPSQGSDEAYNTVYVTLANMFPITCILYASAQITITLLQNEKRMKKMSAAVKSGASPSAENSGDSTTNISTVTKSKSHDKSGSLVRAAKSVVAVAILFLICWTIHFIVNIQDSVSLSSVVKTIESFIGAFYTCTIPYIYLYGVQKLTCSRG